MQASKWDTLFAEFSNILKKPGKPVSCAVDNKIDLLDLSAVPPRPHLYRMSENKLKAVKVIIKE